MIKKYYLAILFSLFALFKVALLWSTYHNDILLRSPQSDPKTYWILGMAIRHGDLFQSESLYTSPLYPFIVAVFVSPIGLAIFQMLLGLLATYCLFSIASTVDQAYSFIANLPLTSYFTSSDREARKATLSKEIEDERLAEARKAAEEATSKAAMTHSTNPAILNLANNDDLDVATIQRQANKPTGASRHGDEVVISLH